jgi:phosphoribosylanthranilate isomerase
MISDEFLRGGGGRVRVKICGITNREDALAAIELGAAALGFNLFEGSKRCVALDREGDWIVALPRSAVRVAVLVNAPLGEALRVAAHPAIDLVQLHGDEDVDYCARFVAASGRSFIKALRLRDAGVIDGADRFSTRHILLDADAGAAFGGSGTLIDLGLAAEFSRRQRALTLILAGGLRAENVACAVQAVHPAAVDVASGVEEQGNPRRKSRVRMRDFFEAVERVNSTLQHRG